MAFLIGGANSDSVAYEISNSLRFNDDDGARLSLNPGTSSDNKTCTLSWWVKLGKPLANGTDYHFSNHTDANNYVRAHISNTGEFALYGELSGSAYVNIYTNGQFKDPSAWYHFMVILDSTDGTAADRTQIWINGVRNTDVELGNSPSQNDDMIWGSRDNMTIGAGHSHDTANTNPYDGYFAEMHFIDGQKKASTDFGKFNGNGVWIPKNYSGTYGTNGWAMEFKQTGTSQNSSGIGADTSGNDNHFAVTNLVATDVTTDTPTNNFATMNPLALTASTFAEGNLKLTGDGGQYDNNVPTIAFDIATTNGWYMEVKLVSGATDDSVIGVCKTDDANLTVNAAATAAGTAADAVGYRGAGNKKINNSNSSYGDSYTDGDIIGVLVKGGTVKFSKNGTIQNSGTAAASSLTGLYYIILAVNGEAVFEANFGNPTVALSSGNADANGYGNFEFAPPSGYYSLCTKNLAEYG